MVSLMPKEKAATEQVRISQELASNVRILAEHFNFKVAGDYIQDRLGPIVERELQAMAKAITAKAKKA